MEYGGCYDDNEMMNINMLQVALMEYRGLKELCMMVTSVEYMEAVRYKQEGLVDTHTYLTKQLI